MKKYIAMSIVTAFVVTNALATDWDSIPFAKTYPMDAQVSTKAPIKTVNKVVKTTVKKVVVKAPEKVAVSTSSDRERIEKLEKSLKKLKKTLSKVKAHDATDNIKWSVDFRTSLDSIEYTSANGDKMKNDSIFSNRLWLDMAYAASPSMIFKGRLSYNKAYGAAPTNNSSGFPQRGFGYDKFDWILNESLTDNELRVREAYWLYMSDSLLGTDIDWTASFGRRPSTNGFLANLRDDDKAKSPLGHVINMEFDGASFKFGLEKLTGVSGMYWKACVGRGLSNARARFNFDGGFDSQGDYTKDDTTLDDIDLAGFIFVPYDDGQYRVLTTAYRGFNVPGFAMADPNIIDPRTKSNTGMIAFADSDGNGIDDRTVFNPGARLQTMGDMDGAAISVLVDGIGEGLGDFADSVKLFASYGVSVTHPNNDINGLDMNAIGQQMQQAGGMENMMVGMEQQVGDGVTQLMTTQGMSQVDATNAVLDKMIQDFSGKEGMLGSNDDKTGISYWVGAQWPCLLTEDAVVGVEYNHGSKYWRPFTYGEDTLIGSKLATRGDAFEVYWTKQLSKAFSIQARYTSINYDYTGSQGFFGQGGTPMSMDEAKQNGMDPIEDAQDIRIYARYRF
jgi:hypothetical protein